MTTTSIQGPERNHRWALAGVSLCVLLASLGTSIANVALPTLMDAFDATFPLVQWVVLTYLLAVTATVVAAGRLGDLFGRRRLLMVGIAVFALASLACAAAPTLGALIAARAVQGVGAAMMMALALAFATEAAPKGKAGSAMGWLGTMSALGTALGPALGGLLTARFGWPALFIIVVPAGVVTWGLVARALPKDGPTVRNGSFDAAGAVLLAAALVAWSLAMTAGHERPGLRHAVLLCIAVTAAWLFVRAEARTERPLVRLSMLRDRVAGAGFAMSFLVTTVVMATLVVGPFYLAGALALGPAGIGMVMTIGPVVAALVGIPAGRIVDRIGATRSTSAGLLFMAFGAVLLVVVPPSLGVAGYAVPLGVLTAGYAWFQAANNAAVMGHATQAERGVTSGVLNLARNVGLVTGASVMGTVFAVAVGGDLVAVTPMDVTRGMHVTFGVASLLLLVALVVARMGRMQPSSGAATCVTCDDTGAH